MVYFMIALMRKLSYVGFFCVRLTGLTRQNDLRQSVFGKMYGH